MILSEDIKKFLVEYVPKSEHFTSYEEFELISIKLNLNEISTSDLIELRNNIVAFYSTLFENETYVDKHGTVHKTEKYWTAHKSMQSVVSVIDFILYN